MSARTVLARSFRSSPRVRVSSTTLRSFALSASRRKTAGETVKGAAKAVDRTVSQAAIKGLDRVEKVNETVKGTAEKMGISMDSGKNQDILEDVTEEAMDAKDEVKRTADQVGKDSVGKSGKGRPA
jgi:hypothetical protein